ncbi:unnamed protein product [Spirodela intermedia]|uniref:Uncharacterized protein n=1 Tax=Spirodela intermedia TaxID=51605 RepID=A0A7I8IH90_SPIIN|nr:unnamed protein product [Spirodela intermedia]CAA6657243.1 unnamed protein product [Spirodela intermedia]
MNFIEAIDEYEIEDREDHQEIQKNVIEGKEEKDFGHSLVVQRLMYAPKKEEPPQHHNIFKTKYTIGGKLCDNYLMLSKNILEYLCWLKKRIFL